MENMFLWDSHAKDLKVSVPIFVVTVIVILQLLFNNYNYRKHRSLFILTAIFIKLNH